MAEAPLGPDTCSVSGGGLVGRQGERSALCGLLAAGAGMALVTGEPGIGKSALLTWLAGEARGRGWRVLRTGLAQGERGLPFAGLADLLGPHWELVRPGLPGPQAEALGAALLKASVPPEGRGDLAVRLATLSALELLAGQQPCLMLIDDAHWLDVPTAQALEYALRRADAPGLTAVFVRRTAARLPGGLGSLLSALPAVEVRLGPLGLAELGEVLAADLGAPPPDRALRVLHHSAQGNPLFALELARAGRDRPFRDGDDDRVPVPVALSGLLRDRMGELSGIARDVLLLVAAAGRLHAADLPGLAGPQGAKDGLEEAVAADVLRLDPDGSLRFAHPLLAGLIYDDAPPAQRRRAHAKLAAQAEDPEPRARHLAASLTIPDGDAAARIADAALVAAARGASHSAAELAARARQLTPATDPQLAWERGLTAAQLYIAAGDTARGRKLLAQLAGTAPAPLHQARALLALNAALGQDVTEGRTLAEQALALAGTDEGVAADAHAQMGLLLHIAGDLPRADQELLRAVDLARRAGNRHAELSALGYLIALRGVAGMSGLAQLLAAHERAAAGTPTAQGYLHPATPAGLVSLFHDDPAAARALFLTAIADAERVGDYYAATGPLLHLVEAEVRLGNLTAATARAAQFQRLEESLDDGVGLYVVALAAAYRGDAATAADAATRGAKLARSQDDIIFTTQNLCVLGILEVSRSQFTAALAPLREARALTRRMGVREPSVYQWHAEHVEASLATGNLAEAAEITSELQELARALNRPSLQALAERCAALVQAAQGQADQALSALTASTARNAEVPFQHARSLLALGTIARRARRKAAARDALTSAQAVFTSMGCVLWSQRAGAELSRVGLRTTAPATLTVTERRIAELVASGRSNREVAAELFLSVKTVEANLSRVYHKLHVTSRTQLARLLPPDQEIASGCQYPGA